MQKKQTSMTKGRVVSPNSRRPVTRSEGFKSRNTQPGVPKKITGSPKRITRFFARIRTRHPTHRILSRNPELMFPKRVVIRLGSTTPSEPGIIEINTVSAIKNCSDKIRMKEIMASGGIKSPVFFMPNALPKELKFPLIKKLRFRSRGHGMEYIENKKQFDDVMRRISGGAYFEEYFESSREYRFHISKNGCFYTCRKMRKEEAKDRWYFNSSNCVWILESNPNYNKPTTYNEIIKECQKALKLLKLDFAAFDVRVKKNGDFAIIEANSAPSFGEYTAERYIKELKELIKDKCAE